MWKHNLKKGTTIQLLQGQAVIKNWLWDENLQAYWIELYINKKRSNHILDQPNHIKNLGHFFLTQSSNDTNTSHTPDQPQPTA